MLESNGILPGNGQKWGNDARAKLIELLENSSVIPAPKGNRGKKKEKQVKYIDVLSAFDIETTAIKEIEQSFMYVWQWAFQSLKTGDTVCIYGRTWEEWLECVYCIVAKINPDCRLVCLDHNLSYEFHFMRGYIDFGFDDVFATDARDIVKCTALNRIEYRCTMRHSNTSLSVYTQQWHVEHKKLSGDDYDYSKIRYPWTELTYDELLYAIHDVLGLIEAYRAEMDYWGDTLYTVPLTSTGYVRRICKKAWATINFYDRLSWMTNLNVTDLLHEAFRGGDTHADRHRSTPLDYDSAVINLVQSWDRASSYPDVLVNCNYPLGDWYRFRNGKDWIQAKEIEKYVHQYGKAIVARVHFRGLRLKDPNWEMPYIPKDKAGYFENPVTDNGRILSADFLSMTITDVDWTIIKEEYIWDDVRFSDAYYCRYRRLPEVFLDVVRGFFRDKTLLKGSPEGSLEEIEYNLKKQLLNALYGMAAQWPIKESVYFLEDRQHNKIEYVNEIDYKIREKEMSENRVMTEKEKNFFRNSYRADLLEKHNKRAFLPYCIGVWCTAWARLELHRSMWTVRDQGGSVVYVDTDSNKFVGDVDMTALNNFYKERSLQNGAWADNKEGKRYYMGVYDYEYTAEFATMGAKKYCYRKVGDDKIHVTIAGVNKRKGAKELQEKGGFAAFHSGTVFIDAGGVKGVYNDAAYGYYEAEGRAVYIGPNVCLLPDTYTLGLSDDYARLLDSIAIRGKIDGYTIGGNDE